MQLAPGRFTSTEPAPFLYVRRMSARHVVLVLVLVLVLLEVSDVSAIGPVPNGDVAAAIKPEPGAQVTADAAARGESDSQASGGTPFSGKSSSVPADASTASGSALRDRPRPVPRASRW